MQGKGGGSSEGRREQREEGAALSHGCPTIVLRRLTTSQCYRELPVAIAHPGKVEASADVAKRAAPRLLPPRGRNAVDAHGGDGGEDGQE
jgi:hypothetical protein